MVINNADNRRHLASQKNSIIFYFKTINGKRKI